MSVVAPLLLSLSFMMALVASLDSSGAGIDSLRVIPPTEYPQHLRSIGDPSRSALRVNSTALRRTDYHQGYDILLSCGVDYQGENLNGADDKVIALSGLGHANCYIFCDWYILNCEAATWTNYNDGTCWFKWTLFPILSFPNEGAVTSFFTIKNPSISDDQFAVYPYGNCDMEGYDIGNERQSTPSGCVSACNKLMNCWAWTWTDYMGGTCWLKNQARTCVVKKGAQSGYHWKRLEKAGTCMGLPPIGIYSP